jgi:hypothetical protein
LLLGLCFCQLSCCSDKGHKIGDGQEFTMVTELLASRLGVLETTWWPTALSPWTCTTQSENDSWIYLTVVQIKMQC